MNGITLGTGNETYHPLAIFRAVRWFELPRTPSPTPQQGRLLRRDDPTILCGAGIAQRVLRYLSLSLQVLLGQFFLSRIQGLPEVGQPLELLRAMFGKLVVLRSSETHGFYPRRDRQHRRADESQGSSFVRGVSSVGEVTDVQDLGIILLGEIEPSLGKQRVCSRFQRVRDVLLVGCDERPPRGCRRFVHGCTVPGPLSALIRQLGSLDGSLPARLRVQIPYTEFQKVFRILDGFEYDRR